MSAEHNELNNYLGSLEKIRNHFSNIGKENQRKQVKLGQKTKEGLLDIVDRFNLPYYYSKFPTASYLSQLPDNISVVEIEDYRRGLVLDSGKPERSDPLIVLEKLGIYQIPIGKKGPDLSGIEEIDIASYPRWFNPALDTIGWYLMITPNETNNFARRLNLKD